MIISRTPLRISFLGGGTDYPEFFEEHGGNVVSTAIDKFVYITVNNLPDFFDHKIRVSYSRTELVEKLEQLQHPAARECLKFMGISTGIEIGSVSDLPARTGLGSSGAYIVGLLNALHVFSEKYVPQERLAAMACDIEIDRMKANIGVQDQYISAVGGLTFFTYISKSEIRHQPVIMPESKKKELNSNLLLFYTGLQRSASQAAQEASQKIHLNKGYLKELAKLARDCNGILQSQSSLSDFGKILDEGWKLKKSLSSSVTNSVVEEIYNEGKRAGALGGKLLGAGGGGFVLLYVEPSFQQAVRSKLKAFKEVPFKFEKTGTQIIFHQS